MGSGDVKWTEQIATAVREVEGLWEIGTMWAEPVWVMWVSWGAICVLAREVE